MRDHQVNQFWSLGALPQRFNGRVIESVPAFLALLFSLLLGHFHLLSLFQVVTHTKISSRPRSKLKLREPQVSRLSKTRFRPE